MTERLYYRDAALLEFDAIVVRHAGDALHVVLDRTAFYPTSGGQPHDVGHLGGAAVIDVIDADDGIVHVTSTPVALGPVRGTIDERRRRDHMQQHTAQHLLSALAADRFGWETASVHFGVEHSTVEFATGAASTRQLDELEERANDVVAESRSVTVTFEDALAAEQAGLRKPSGRAGEIRVIAIAGLDRSACGGTHVSTSSEIGPILLVGSEKVRGNTRVGFLAGDRVLRHARSTAARLQALARELGCAVPELDALVTARQHELKAAREQVGALEQELAAARIRSLFDAAMPDPDGLRRLLFRAAAESPALLRAMAQTAVTLERALFAAIVDAPATIYFAASADSGVDAGARLKPALAAVGGRGGGSARVAQGTAASLDVLQRVAATLMDSSRAG